MSARAVAVNQLLHAGGSGLFDWVTFFTLVQRL